MMYIWENVTENFSEMQRHYKDTYLEIDEVYNGEVEVSLFSSVSGPYEIYISYGRMYGIVYASADEAETKRQEIKEVLAKEYETNREPSSEFIDEFVEKYQVELPMDVFFDF